MKNKIKSVLVLTITALICATLLYLVLYITGGIK